MTAPQASQIRFAASRSPRLIALAVGALLGAGCLAHTAVATDGPPENPVAPEDGLPASKLEIPAPSDTWEAEARTECADEPEGEGCPKLFHLAADRMRGSSRTDEAPELLVHACAQGHGASCAAVELFKAPNLENAKTLARIGCPTPFAGDDCHAAAAVLSHACNERRQATSCLVLADLFESADQPNPVWTQHYRVRACAFGGICAPQPTERTEAAPRQPSMSAD